MTGTEKTISILPPTTLSDLKAQIADPQHADPQHADPFIMDPFNKPVDRIKLMFQFKELKGNQKLSYYGIKDNSNLDLLISPTPSKLEKEFDLHFKAYDGVVKEGYLRLPKDTTYAALLQHLFNVCKESPDQTMDAFVVRHKGSLLHVIDPLYLPQPQTIQFLDSRFPLDISFDEPIYDANVNVFLENTQQRWKNVILERPIYQHTHLSILSDMVMDQLGLVSFQDGSHPIELGQQDIEQIMDANKAGIQGKGIIALRKGPIFIDTYESHTVDHVGELVQNGSIPIVRVLPEGATLFSMVFALYQPRAGGRRTRRRHASMRAAKKRKTRCR